MLTQPPGQSSPDAVAMAYITAFYSGDSRSIKKLLEPSVLAEIEADSDTRLVFVAVENIGNYVRSGGGWTKWMASTNSNHFSSTFDSTLEEAYAIT
ncbi:hypothetical protein [Paenalcaligenes suwonensis]|uniref:hypothetical protein n=1 Tax=Paenalcaligenes suwonensis TaxID=1202713 RepID=UPI0014079966|nr:hypothetical protein [Paenalcaligenes suwonensis]NHC61677.1 hypothetical protein [Paenalcaligenes suwonensis]